jgi:hypothetical protein
LNDAFIAGWQQSLVDGAKHVAVGGKTLVVRRTAKYNLAGVDFERDGIPYRRPRAKPSNQIPPSRIGPPRCQGHAIPSAGCYLAVLFSGKVTHYTRSKS